MPHLPDRQEGITEGPPPRCFAGAPETVRLWGGGEGWVGKSLFTRGPVNRDCRRIRPRCCEVPGLLALTVTPLSLTATGPGGRSGGSTDAHLPPGRGSPQNLIWRYVAPCAGRPVATDAQRGRPRRPAWGWHAGGRAAIGVYDTMHKPSPLTSGPRGAAGGVRPMSRSCRGETQSRTPGIWHISAGYLRAWGRRSAPGIADGGAWPGWSSSRLLLVTVFLDSCGRGGRWCDWIGADPLAQEGLTRLGGFREKTPRAALARILSTCQGGILVQRADRRAGGGVSPRDRDAREDETTGTEVGTIIICHLAAGAQRDRRRRAAEAPSSDRHTI